MFKPHYCLLIFILVEKEILLSGIVRPDILDTFLFLICPQKYTLFSYLQTFCQTISLFPALKFIILAKTKR